MQCIPSGITFPPAAHKPDDAEQKRIKRIDRCFVFFSNFTEKNTGINDEFFENRTRWEWFIYRCDTIRSSVRKRPFLDHKRVNFFIFFFFTKNNTSFWFCFSGRGGGGCTYRLCRTIVTVRKRTRKHFSSARACLTEVRFCHGMPLNRRRRRRRRPRHVRSRPIPKTAFREESVVASWERDRRQTAATPYWTARGRRERISREPAARDPTAPASTHPLYPTSPSPDPLLARTRRYSAPPPTITPFPHTDVRGMTVKNNHANGEIGGGKTVFGANLICRILLVTGSDNTRFHNVPNRVCSNKK